MGKAARLKKKRRVSETLQRALDAVMAYESPAMTLPRLEDHPEQKAALEAFDNFSSNRNRMAKIAGSIGEWAGIPIPIDGERLVIEPSYPFAKFLSEQQEEEPTDPRDAGWTAVNRWYCDKKRADIIVMRHKDGRTDWGISRAFHSFDQQMATLGCSFAWGIEQEHKAVRLLGTLLRHHQLKTYLLTGSFLETSKRSGLIYMFRRLRPTVVLTPHSGGDKLRILIALCLHPIAYYDGSWAGAMCPTDDVVAHLMLMRGDEAMFWKRANHHPAWRPEAGL